MIAIIGLIAIGAILVVTAIGGEKKSFNNGVCKVCNQRLKHFDTDSQGGRGYTCPSMHYSVWVSYHCVDKSKKRKE